MAKALANAGAKKVYILARRKEVLDEAAKAHESLHPLLCDVGSKESLQAAVDTISKESGYVNLVIANSGVLGPAAKFHPDSSVADLKRRLFDEVSMVSPLESFISLSSRLRASLLLHAPEIWAELLLYSVITDSKALIGRLLAHDGNQRDGCILHHAGLPRATRCRQ